MRIDEQNWRLYEFQPSFVLGFHGCDRSVGEAVLNGEIQHLKPSVNDYDWLGEGIYFWESNPARALQFAQERAAGGKNSQGEISEPFVIGAVLNLRHCLSTTESSALFRLRSAYQTLVSASQQSGTVLPTNGQSLRQRRLDCAVFNLLPLLEEEPIDSVRAAFWEGESLYPGAGLREADHIQICVRNSECILGYFRPIAVTG
ncbi:MAG TPA: hypothetical protein VF627_04345 [Abditibacterium sp.]|jgi:hypothetical protein